MERHSPLDAHHRALGAKMVPFGGWVMPLSYPDGTLAEHRACRTGAVAFDVSHLGTVRVEGPAAVDHLQATLSNDLTKIGPGRCQYTHLLGADGSVVDDIIVWWTSADRFDVMPNASNTDRVVAALGGVDGVTARDVTGERAVLAVQGPHAREVLASLWPEVAAVGRFRTASATIDGIEVVVAGTGYTGEDGIEIAVPTEHAGAVFDALLAAGITPAGLGARDTLRLEAGLPLYGYELGPGITPLHVGLEWVVGWNKPTFIGRDALIARRESGVERRLVGLLCADRRPPRTGDQVLDGDVAVGQVTSGNFSPSLERGIAMAFVDSDWLAAGSAQPAAPETADRDDSGSTRRPQLSIAGRKEPRPAELVELPFVSR